MALLNFSKDYTGGGLMNTLKSFLPITCGVSKSAFNNINKQKYSVQLMVIPKGEVQPKLVINAWLQEKFEFEVSSDWTNVADMGDFGVIGDVFRLGTGKTLTSTLTSRRKWRGSTPIEMNFKLKFEAEDDVINEVVKPCYSLQALALPSRGASRDWLLTPPGPNPFYIDNGFAKSVKLPGGVQPFGPGEEITISIGGFMVFKSVILKRTHVVFENRMGEAGPIGASAEIVIQTYEMLTREDLADAYRIDKNLLGVG